MLHQGALGEYLCRLRARSGQLRLGLGDVETGRNARAMALFRDLERAVEGSDGIVENGIFAVETAQLHIVVHRVDDFNLQMAMNRGTDAEKIQLDGRVRKTPSTSMQELLSEEVFV